MLLEVVVVWLVVSPVLGVSLGLLIARAARMAERREPLPAPVGQGLGQAVGQLRTPGTAARSGEEVAAAVAAPSASAVVTDVPGAPPAPAGDEVLRLRLARQER